MQAWWHDCARGQSERPSDTKTDTKTVKIGKVRLRRFHLIPAQNRAFLPRNRGEKRPIPTLASTRRCLGTSELRNSEARVSVDSSVF